MQESFLSFRHFRYLKLSALLLLICVVLYLVDRPPNGRNGGSWAGYTLGTLGALLILLLLWFGVRKRQFRSALGNVRGWLSAHVYLGSALAVIVTLHAAFQFGWNVHTLAYVLLLAVVASGLYGATAYGRYPELMSANLEGRNPAEMLEEVAQLETRCLELAESVDQETYQTVLASIRRAQIGGGLWRQLFGARRRVREDVAIGTLLRRGRALAERNGAASPSAHTELAGMTLRVMAEQLASAGAGQQVEALRELLENLARKRDLVERINRDVRLRARLQVWLYLHVPLSLALLAALTAHIVAVFFYW